MVLYCDQDSDTSEFFQEAEEMKKSFKRLFLPCAPAATNMNCPTRGLSRGLNTSDIKKKMTCRGFDIDEPVVPDWRKGPIRSLSDWTLVVHNGISSDIYHVHKMVLSFGPRRSMLFVKAFGEAKQGPTKNGPSSSTTPNKSSTEIAIHKEAASRIPMMLDYIYCNTLDLTSENAPAARFLANYFDIRELHKKASSFIQSDMSLTTAPIYMTRADKLMDKEILNSAIHIAISQFHSVDMEYYAALPPNIFHQIVSSPHMMCTSEDLSEKIAQYLRKQTHTMMDEMFYFLTNPKLVPRISSREAMWYLGFSANHFPSVLTDESYNGYQGSLKYRCMMAACQDWKDNLVGPINDMVECRGNHNKVGNVGVRSHGYDTLPLDIKVEVLEEALLHISMRYKE